ncbi:MAG: TatD family hydrolase [Planctomycetota bacterium]
MDLIDTHAHLDFPQFASALGAVLDRAREAGLRAVITVGTSAAASERSVKLLGADDLLFAAVGVHPHDAKSASPADLDVIERLAGLPRVVAVGETGLDYARDLSPGASQRELFVWHMDLAVRSAKTLIVHNRDADADCRALLSRHPVHLPLVLHCFSGDTEMIRWALDRNCFISVAGQVTYPKAAVLRAAVKQIPLDRLLLETDSPFLTPEPHRSRTRSNEPSFVAATAEVVAELRDLPPEDLASATTDNARRAFGLPESRRGA